MKNLLKCAVLVLCSTIHLHASEPFRVMVLDTEPKAPECSEPLQRILSLLSLDVRYENLFSFLMKQRQPDAKPLSAFNSVVLLARQSFLAHQDSTHVKPLLDALADFCSQKDKSLVFLSSAAFTTDTSKQLSQLMHTCAIVPQDAMPNAEFNHVTEYLFNARALKGAHVERMLFAKDDKAPESDIIDRQFESSKGRVFYLPERGTVTDDLILKTWPSLVVFLQNKNFVHAVGHSAELLVSGIEPDLLTEPLDLNVTRRLLHNGLRTMHQFFSRVRGKDLTLPLLPTEQLFGTPRGIPASPSASRNNGPLSCAWITPYYDFGLKSFSSGEAQCLEGLAPEARELLQKDASARLLNALVKTRPTMLWFEAMPEKYLQQDGILAHERDQYVAQMSKIMADIKNAYKDSSQELPEIFVGVWPTANFKEKKTENPVVDFYGQKYEKMPSPLYYGEMWRKQVVESMICNDFC